MAEVDKAVERIRATWAYRLPVVAYRCLLLRIEPARGRPTPFWWFLGISGEGWLRMGEGPAKAQDQGVDTSLPA